MTGVSAQGLNIVGVPEEVWVATMRLDMVSHQSAGVALNTTTFAAGKQVSYQDLPS
jgi:hypothetical protein